MSLHDIAYTFLYSFVALFPVLNPIGNGFIVSDFLVGVEKAQRKAIIRKIALNCLLIGLCSLVAGKLVLLAFNLAVPVIQVGGGILICKTGSDWLSGPVANAAPAEGQQVIDTIALSRLEQNVFYPISFPICFGPGSISVIFTLMAMMPAKESVGGAMLDYLAIALAIAALCGILYFMFLEGRRLMDYMGHSASLAINKLVAFLTFCVGIQIIVTGVSKIFHIPVL